MCCAGTRTLHNPIREENSTHNHFRLAHNRKPKLSVKAQRTLVLLPNSELHGCVPVCSGPRQCLLHEPFPKAAALFAWINIQAHQFDR